MLEVFFDNWDKIASLFLSMVAIGIAIFSSRATSRNANEQIKTLEKLISSNTKDAEHQIESIKQMTQEATDGVKKQMIGFRNLAITILEASIVNLDEEIRKAYEDLKEKSKYQEDLSKIYKDYDKNERDDELAIHNFINNETEYDKELYFLNRKYEKLEHLRLELVHLKEIISQEVDEAITSAKTHGTFDSLYGEMKEL